MLLRLRTVWWIWGWDYLHSYVWTWLWRVQSSQFSYGQGHHDGHWHAAISVACIAKDRPSSQHFLALWMSMLMLHIYVKSFKQSMITSVFCLYICPMAFYSNWWVLVGVCALIWAQLRVILHAVRDFRHTVLWPTSSGSEEANWRMIESKLTEL